MDRIRNSFAIIIGATLVVWLTAELPLWLGADAARRIGDSVMQGSGVLAIVLMSLALVLAARPRWVEHRIGGLDKMYRLHKWLGIANLIVAAAHWLAFGFIRSEGAETVAPAAGGWAGLTARLHDTALAMGSLAWKVVLVLSILALVKRFPYRLFFKSHWLFVPTYLVLIFHGVILLDVGAWTSPLGPLLTVVLVAGAGSGILCLLRSFGAVEHRAIGTIIGLTRHEAIRSLEVELELDSRWPGHQAGQFAFLKTDASNEAHPFTILSAWTGDGRITFLIKELGDYTGALYDRLKIGDEVRVEGPWGRFDFAGDGARQLWIAGGVGITPFIARMEQLRSRTDDRPIDLFFSTPTAYPVGDAILNEMAAAAGVRLHLRFSDSEGLLTAAEIADQVPDLTRIDVWFCGPVGMGDAMRRRLVEKGLPEERFHQELFQMR